MNDVQMRAIVAAILIAGGKSPQRAMELAQRLQAMANEPWK